MTKLRELPAVDILILGKDSHEFWMNNIDFTVDQKDVYFNLNQLRFYLDNWNQKGSYEEVVEILEWFQKNKEKIIFKAE